jgi:aspartyl-tRNA(Asn)/glutamyl-tRNA(Gln) amidotransferase subunit C
MASADIDVNYVAHLARLALAPDEAAKLGLQLGQVLAYIQKLQELDVSQVEPTAHTTPRANVTRPDEVRPSLPPEAALANAPAKANQLFLVPKIVE